MKAKRVKELEKKYEAVSLILGPKDKSGLRICSVPEKKLRALAKWHLGKDKNHLILE